MKIIPLLLLLLGLASTSPAAEFELPKFGQPVSKLPSTVRAEANLLSLVADFSNRDKQGQIPVYLINNTTKAVELDAEDGDVYLKLETQDPDGKWQRAEPHAYSWCGNSYARKELQAGHFLRIPGYQPAKGGSKSKVRFSFYGQKLQLSSNEGKALVAKKDIDLASRDSMRLQTGDFDLVSKVALGEIQLVNEMDHELDLQAHAVVELADPRFDATAARKVLDKVAEKFPKEADRVDYVRKEIQARLDEPAVDPKE